MIKWAVYIQTSKKNKNFKKKKKKKKNFFFFMSVQFLICLTSDRVYFNFPC